MPAAFAAERYIFDGAKRYIPGPVECWAIFSK